MMEGLAQLFQNKLFLQYLSGAGADIAAGGTGVQAMNQITQQNISGQNYANLLSKMLSGDVMQDGKVTMDQKGLNLIIPKTHMPGLTKGGTEMNMGATNAPGGIANTQRNQLLEVFSNPSNSQPSKITDSDLAGLSPQDISGALAGALGVKGFDQKKITDQVDMFLKMSQSVDILRGDPADRTYPMGVPGINAKTKANPYGIGIVSQRQWTTLPVDQKQYAAYVNLALKLGDSEILNFEDFTNTFDKTDREKFLDSAIKRPEIMEAAKELAKSSATKITIGESVKKAGALADVKTEKWFTDPKGIGKSATDYIASEEVQNKLFPLIDKPREYAKTKSEIIESWYMRMIKGSGGKIKSSRLEGRDFVWVVLWPSGKTSEVRYAN